MSETDTKSKGEGGGQNTNERELTLLLLVPFISLKVTLVGRDLLVVVLICNHRQQSWISRGDE